jgi:uncharacterized protein
MTRLAGFCALLIAAALSLVGPAPSRAAATPEPQFPALTGRVVDDAHILSPEETANLTAQLAGLEAKTSRQLVVVTLPSLQGYDIADYGYQLLRHWGIGQKGLDNGAILIVAPSEHKVRIEVGYGLEPILPDALCSQILQEKVLPAFRGGDMAAGVSAGVSALIDQLSLDPTRAEQKAAAADQNVRPVYYRHGSGLGRLVPILLLVFIFSAVFRRRGGAGWLLPFLFLGGGGGWGGGRDDGFGGGGFGGFSGGGGSGGGGGASGGW